MGRKISDENLWTSFVVLFFFVSFLFAPNIYFFNFNHCVSIITNFVFKILNLLTLLKQEGAQ